MCLCVQEVTAVDTRPAKANAKTGIVRASPALMRLRPGNTPSGTESRTLIKHLVRRIRRHWPRTRIVLRGDSHYGRAEAMAWCEENGIDYIFGLAGNRALHALAHEVTDDLKVCRARGRRRQDAQLHRPPCRHLARRRGDHRK